MKTKTVGAVIGVHINQATRYCQVVEVLPDYALAIYTMPAGRATLTRIRHETTPYLLSNASKKERNRHAKALIEASLGALEDAQLDIEGMRLADWKKRSRLHQIDRQMQRLQEDLAKLVAAPATPSP